MIYLNNEQVNITIFPDNTSQCWHLPESVLSLDHVSIKWEFSHEGEFMQLAQLKTLLNQYNVEASLHITYLPYGRQDKKVNNNTTFALHTFSMLLNTLDFKTVNIDDPHNPRTEKLINNLNINYPIDKVYDVFSVTKSNVVCYPDSGAFDKYRNVYKYPYVFARKERCPATGIITKCEFIGDVNNKNVLIVDDICDGGRTFIFLTEKLLAAGANEVNLFVTHGLFSGGVKMVKDSGIKRIFTNKGEAIQEQDGMTSFKEIK